MIKDSENVSSMVLGYIGIPWLKLSLLEYWA